MTHEIILCVDDDISVLNALRTLLAGTLAPHQSVEIAESGEEALELVGEMERDGDALAVVIADYIMPGMKGDDLLARIHARQPGTVKIMLTGQSHLSGVKRAINEAGLFRFLEKPWQNDDIVLTVQAALRTWQLDRALQRKTAALEQLTATLEQIVTERTRALAEKNAELEKLSITDSLTGLYNRLLLDRMLASLLADARRHGQPFSLLLLDLDHFKRINDSHGHPAGDAVLRACGSLLPRLLREQDLAGRWGGEEFLILCPNTGEAGASATAGKLLAAIAAHDFGPAGPCTASCGTATWQDQDSAESLLARADQALYQAKQGGRNQVCAG